MPYDKKNARNDSIDLLPGIDVYCTQSCAYFYTSLALGHVINSTDLELTGIEALSQLKAVVNKKCIIIADCDTERTYRFNL